MPKYKTEIVITTSSEDCTHELIVMYDYLPAEKGVWQYGMQIEPSYPHDVSVWEAYIESGDDRLYMMPFMSKGQIRQLELDILDTYEE